MITCVQVDCAAVAMKRCTKCGGDKRLDEFHVLRASADGRQPKCKVCRREYAAANSAKNVARAVRWMKNNPERRTAIRKRWDEKHREQKRAYHRTPEAKKRSSARQKERFENDANFRLKVTLRARVKSALRGIAATKDTIALLGCDIPTLRAHLEAQFKPGMTWETYGRNGWHIDHRKPCSSFDLTDPAHQRACFHYTNLQPLWEIENKMKAAKVL